MNPKTPNGRDAERSRNAILEASAQLFSQHGFNNTSVQQIADAANVARGTPNYFFGSKEELFKAVLERESQIASNVVPSALAKLGAKLFPEKAIGALIDAQMDFAESHARFYRLLQWTSLENPHLVDNVQAHQKAFELSEQAVKMVYGKNISASETKQMVVSILGATTFLAFFGETTAKGLGIDPNSKSFRAARRLHLKHLLTTVWRSDQKAAKKTTTSSTKKTKE